ncbi:MAG: DNA lyase [Anaerolineales bacterium]|nr:DNA lyase [Anaerolineales bacterium]
MRLWTLHPQYLDRQGLLAVWREGLLAQAVLRGQTKGYKNHPQLDRFKAHSDPQQAIAYFLAGVLQEARARGYNFDASKINPNGTAPQIQTAAGQLDYEFSHLLAKLEKRSPADHEKIAKLKAVTPHPLFQIVPGEIEDWERV